MNRQMLTVLAVMAGTALVLGDTNCTSTCTGQQIISGNLIIAFLGKYQILCIFYSHRPFYSLILVYKKHFPYNKK